MIEETFAMVKPDAVEGGHVGAVLTRISSEGFRVVEMRQHRFSPGDVDGFYEEHVGRHFYEAMRDFLCSGPSVLLVLEREGAIARWRAVIGPTDPRKAVAAEQFPLPAGQQRTLRGLYGDVRDGAPMFRNAVHGSDSVASAMREIAFFFGGRRWSRAGRSLPPEALRRLVDRYVALDEVSEPGINGPLPGGAWPKQRLTLGSRGNFSFPIFEETATCLEKRRDLLVSLLGAFSEDVMAAAAAEPDRP